MDDSKTFEINNKMNSILLLKTREDVKKPTVQLKRSIDFLSPKEKTSQNYEVQNGLYQNRLFNRERHLTNVLNILLIVDALLLYLYYATESTSNFSKSYWLPLSYVIHIFIVITHALIFRVKYDSIDRLKKYNFSPNISIIKLTLNLLIHPLPWCNYLTVDISYDDPSYVNLSFPLKVNYILVIITLVKNILLLFIKMTINTHYFGPRSKRIKKIYTVSVLEEVYAYRCIFVENPIKMVGCFYLTGYLFFSLAFQITESAVPIDNNPFIHFENCLWFTFITNTTVGYGDVHLFTHLGYVVEVFCLIWGTLIISCILVVLINTLSMNTKELESLSSLKRVDSQLEYKQLCKQYIRISVYRLWRNFKYNQQIKETIAERKLRTTLGQTRRLNRSYNPMSNLVELAQRQFDNANINTQYLRENNIQIISFIGNHIFSEALGQKKEQRSRTAHELEKTETKLNEDIKSKKSVQLPRMTPLRLEDMSSSDIDSMRSHERME